jgi:hypothetical protein
MSLEIAVVVVHAFRIWRGRGQQAVLDTEGGARLATPPRANIAS